MFSKTKRFILVPILVVMLLVVGTTGAVLANDEEGESPRISFIGVVADALGVEASELQNIYTEAREAVQEVPIEERAEAFKAAVADALDITVDELQYAIDEATEDMRARIRNRTTTMSEQLETIRAQLRTRYAARMQNMQGQLEERGINLRERIQSRMGEMQGRLDNLIGEAQQHGAQGADGNGSRTTGHSGSGNRRTD
ncbi:hypothetical protein ACFLX7_04970 [Chloroflexota bacterium]